MGNPKTAPPDKWVLGIDPGFGHTGAVLRSAQCAEPTAWACWENNEIRDWPVLRSLSIARPLVETVLELIDDYSVEELEVCIETPFYNHNARSLMLQMSLFSILCEHMYLYVRPHVVQLWLTVVHNRTSKKFLTQDGGADKNAMIAASPWAAYKQYDLTHLQAHTLADAYAHSLSAGQEEYDLTAMQQYSVPWTVRRLYADS